MSYSIAIDGPAGAGKSTIAKKIAKQLGFLYIDTGAMYRAMALYLLRNHIRENEEASISEACKKITITIAHQNNVQQVFLNDENVNELIRTEEVSQMASKSSVNKDIRMKLVELQRKMAEKENIIMDGRDIGTYVLPNANLKIYLTANSGVRAQRRFQELTGKGIPCNVNDIEQDIIERDKRDMNREFAPLKRAEDAIVVDTSSMTIDEVVDTVVELVRCQDKKGNI